MRYLILLLPVLMFSSGLKISKHDLHFKKEYNKYFFMYSHIYDWKLIKAQAYQESRFKDNAVSPVGARGIMQIMPGTFDQISRELSIKGGNPFDSSLGITMGVYYDYKMFKIWKSERTVESKFKLMLASYNAGAGHLLNSQKKCSKVYLKCNEYENIIEFLPSITGHNSKETINYVDYILKFYKSI